MLMILYFRTFLMQNFKFIN
uniref:Uncharacterized protein n=1 Tax=Rhizophora mucronata TaxID=61149 RepID=A0A2P2PD46_RHIMU